MFQAIVHVTRTMLKVIGWFAVSVVMLMLSMLGVTIMALFVDWSAEQLILVAFIVWPISFAYLLWGPRQTGSRRRSSVGSSYSSGSSAAAGLSGLGAAAGLSGGGSSCGGGGVGVVKRKVLGTEFIEQFGMDEQSLAHLVKAVLDVSAGQ
jgi:uncharacterized membrane protein YgcG